MDHHEFISITLSYLQKYYFMELNKVRNLYHINDKRNKNIHSCEEGEFKYSYNYSTY